MVLFTVVKCEAAMSSDVSRYVRNVLQHAEQSAVASVDGDPDFIVGVRGMAQPLCFRLEGEPGHVVRLLQDPESGVVVNARISRPVPGSNKTYLSAVLISRRNFRVVAKVGHVLVNRYRFAWGPVSVRLVHGHRVLIAPTLLALTLRNKNVTLIVKRHLPEGRVQANGTDDTANPSSAPNTASSSRQGATRNNDNNNNNNNNDNHDDDGTSRANRRRANRRRNQVDRGPRTRSRRHRRKKKRQDVRKQDDSDDSGNDNLKKGRSKESQTNSNNGGSKDDKDRTSNGDTKELGSKKSQKNTNKNRKEVQKQDDTKDRSMTRTGNGERVKKGPKKSKKNGINRNKNTDRNKVRKKKKSDDKRNDRKRNGDIKTDRPKNSKKNSNSDRNEARNKGKSKARRKNNKKDIKRKMTDSGDKRSRSPIPAQERTKRNVESQPEDYRNNNDKNTYLDNNKYSNSNKSNNKNKYRNHKNKYNNNYYYYDYNTTTTLTKNSTNHPGRYRRTATIGPAPANARTDHDDDDEDDEDEDNTDGDDEEEQDEESTTRRVPTRELAAYVGFYVADAQDLSLETHGLLGQFLYKAVTLQTVRRKSNGVLKARLLVARPRPHSVKAKRRTRVNLALNASSTCWWLRDGGRGVVEGEYEHYLLDRFRDTEMLPLPRGRIGQ